MKTKLTNSAVDGLKPKPTPYEVTDSEVIQLVLRISPTGHKAYYARYRRKDGTQTRAKLGDASTLTPTQARNAARAKLADVAIRGTDPNEDKRRVRAEAKAKAMTLEAFLDGDYGKWATANRKDGARNVPRLKSSFKELLVKSLMDITAKDVEDWRTKRIKAKWAKANKSEESVNRARATGSRDIALLKACLSRAVQLGCIDVNPLKGERGVKIPKVDRKSTIRAITPDEEKRLFEAMVKREAKQREARESHNVWLRERRTDEMPPFGTFADYLRPFISVLLHTGMRRNEGFQLRWSDINFEDGELRVRAGVAKSGKGRAIPLNAVALDVLRLWQKQANAVAADDVVFASPQTGDTLTNVNTAWRGVTKDAGLKGLRLHDLRHTFASRVLQGGATITEVQELLGHADITTTSVYLHTSREGKRRAVDTLAATPGNNIAEFPAAKAQG